jgi:hypothetical protein
MLQEINIKKLGEEQLKIMKLTNLIQDGLVQIANRKEKIGKEKLL